MTEILTVKYKDLLVLMESLEQGMKHYYEGLSERFTKPELQRLWVTMAEQEETHTRLVRLMRKRSMADEDLQNSDMKVNAHEYHTINNFLEEYPQVLQEEELSLRKGFEIALTLESLELTPIYRPFIARQDKPTRDVLEELLESEDMHLHILVKAVKKHIDDPDFHDYADQVLRQSSDASSP
ncbi:MAG TPA: hypothetical protein VKA68_02775 [bacterium]|nr:hypothetical protein [bacterium]